MPSLLASIFFVKKKARPSAEIEGIGLRREEGVG